MYFTKIILIISHFHVKSEWVEISQQHYRKSVTKGDNYRDQPEVDFSEINRKQYEKLIDKLEHKEIVKDNLHNDVTVNFEHNKAKLIAEENNLNASSKPSVIDTEDMQKKMLKDKENKSDKPLNKDTLSNDNKLKTILNSLKLIADTIAKNTHASFDSKLKYLQNLQQTILNNIEDRIIATWPDDELDKKDEVHGEQSASFKQTRRSRSAPAPRGQVDFPSTEGSLMTISFLTFAVFLIKLVLQVVHTYKNKTMMLTPTLFAVSKAAMAAGKVTRD